MGFWTTAVRLLLPSALFASGCRWFPFGPDLESPLSRTGEIRVLPGNGVWDEEYGRTDDPKNCSFVFEVLRYPEGIRVVATVWDDRLVTDDCTPGAVSCPSWDDDNLEVFFDGDNDRSPDVRAGNGIRSGGEFTLVANGAAQSDFSSLPKSFGTAWRGTARPVRQADGSWRIDYDLFFTWACLGSRRAPRPDEDVTFGFNICVHDDDDGGRNDHALYWKGNPARPYRDESRFGTITLEGRK
ncbi:MAG: sugar-binding protein [Kiritimatiellia bacterium]